MPADSGRSDRKSGDPRAAGAGVSGHVIVGRIKRAHGIRGEIVVEPLTDSPDVVFAPGRRLFAADTSGDMPAEAPAPELHISRVRPFGRNLLVIFAEMGDRSAAEVWRGRYLTLPENEVEPPDEGQLFLHELAGMRVVAADDRRNFGEVVSHYQLPQGLMLEVARPSGGTALLPFREEMIVQVDRATRTILVRVPEGLFDV